MAQVSREFRRVMKENGWKAEDAARELKVSRASFYNYLAKKDVPSLDVLRRANRQWKTKFTYGSYRLDDQFFENLPKVSGPPKEKQMALPFIEGLRNQDIQVLEVTPFKPNAVDVKLRIKFAG